MENFHVAPQPHSLQSSLQSSLQTALQTALHSKHQVQHQGKIFLSKIKISYIIAIFVAILISIYLCIIIKSPFWSRQPVFHSYNIRYLLYDAMIPGRVIQKNTKRATTNDRAPNIVPRSFKYENYINISTVKTSNLSPEKWQKITEFISTYYLNNDVGIYSPTVDNIRPYFSNNYKESSVISLYHGEKKHGVNGLNRGDLNGLITSRILRFTITGFKSFNVYYVDFLCVHEKHRGKGIAPQLIQMHECNQRREIPLEVSLFKKEGVLHSIIIPLVVFNSYIYDVSKFKKKTRIHSSYSIILISKTNIYLFWDLLENFKHLFKCTILTSMANLIDLIVSHNVFVFCLLHGGEIVAAYLFRTTKTTLKLEPNTKRNTIELFASLTTSDTHQDAFIIAFRDIVISNFGNFYLIVENISFNSVINDNISISYKPLVQSQVAYYIYNYAVHSFRHNEIFIIS
jgi:hypothetical protein